MRKDGPSQKQKFCAHISCQSAAQYTVYRSRLSFVYSNIVYYLIFKILISGMYMK